MSQHRAKFTWGVGPEKVFVAGSFNNWSGDSSPLTKQPDGSFAAEVDVPWGEKVAFKYVVDGEWKIREDEAKEWDAAGNMNNVYTAPHAPETDTTAAAAAAPATTAAASKDATSTTTKPETLLAANAPAAASGGATDSEVKAAGTSYAPLGAAAVGAGAAGATAGAAAVAGAASDKDKSTATAAVPVEAAPATTEPTPVKIEKTAANANVGEAPAGDQDHTIAEKAAEYGAGALGALGAAVTGAVVAAEKAIGVDVTHSSPTDQMTVEEAKAKGIDVNTLEKKDAPTDAVSPAGTKPSADGIAALEEKTKDLKVDTAPSDKGLSSVPLPNGGEPSKTMTSESAVAAMKDNARGEEQPKHDIPAQDETGDNHKTVPAPTITPISPRDPAKDRSLDASNAAGAGANTDTAGTKPISSDPAIDPAVAKKEAEQAPAATGSTPATVNGAATTTGTETASKTPDAAAATASETIAPTVTGSTPGNPAPGTVQTTTPGTGKDGSAAIKDTTGATVSPSTPAKKSAAAGAAIGAGNPATPKDGIDRKRKSSLFSKIKHALSPKDKEKK